MDERNNKFGIGFKVMYVICSYSTDGEEKFLEVKTTRGTAQTACIMTVNEVEFSRQRHNNYFLYRVFDFEENRNSARFYVQQGPVGDSFDLTPTQFRVVLK